MFKGYNKGSEVWVWRTQVMNDGWESSQEILNWKNSSEERSRMELCGRAFIISQKQTHCSHTLLLCRCFPFSDAPSLNLSSSLPLLFTVHVADKRSSDK
jgi:hypothetical protein